jgi:quinoprotein dehydrogenase-associated probable ABC transporter substrate-binding protein
MHGLMQHCDALVIPTAEIVDSSNDFGGWYRAPGCQRESEGGGAPNKEPCQRSFFMTVGMRRQTSMRMLRAACAIAGFVVILGLVLIAEPASAQAPGLGSSAELVDPHTFRVCADPHDLPFSNEAGEGFENKLAELFASKLGEPTSYTYYPQVIGFVRNTLNALRCDVVMGDVVGDDLMQTTNPYYRTTYALVFKPGNGLDGVETLEDKRLKDKHIGIIAGTPPSIVFVQQGLMVLAKPYPLTADTRIEVPSQTMVNDIASGQIDAGVLWGPIAGYYAQHATPHLVTVPLLKEPAQMDFRIALGVRHSDQEWKRRLNRLIAENRPEIDRILQQYGVPLLDEQGKLVTP